MNWLVENWKLILLGIGLAVAVADLLVSIFRKKAVVKDNNLVALVKCLPDFIKAAEDSSLNGKEKLNAVLINAIDFLYKVTGEDKVVLNAKYLPIITELVENILECPQKKEEKKDA